MDEALRRAVEAVIAEATGSRVSIRAARPVGGGCIHDARLVELEDGRCWFVKASAGVAEDTFEREAEGLRALGAPAVIRVPAVAGCGAAEGTRFLALEAIERGAPKAGFFADFGRRLAALHRRATSPQAGFDADNYLGSTPQPNPWCDSWVGFFREHRLGHQLRLAADRGLADAELQRRGERLLERLDDLLDLPDEPFCLLHGDLWSGNFMVDDAGEPVLVDPAAYYGHREAELAMCELFGGFPGDFLGAYQEAWPLPAGSPERREIYRLYHLLNHLNLFGGGYRSGCLGTLRRFT